MSNDKYDKYLGQVLIHDHHIHCFLQSIDHETSPCSSLSTNQRLRSSATRLHGTVQSGGLSMIPAHVQPISQVHAPLEVCGRALGRLAVRDALHRQGMPRVRGLLSKPCTQVVHHRFDQLLVVHVCKTIDQSTSHAASVCAGDLRGVPSNIRMHTMCMATSIAHHAVWP